VTYEVDDAGIEEIQISKSSKAESTTSRQLNTVVAVDAVSRVRLRCDYMGIRIPDVMYIERWNQKLILKKGRGRLSFY
jgi:hypothetical protein